MVATTHWIATEPENHQLEFTSQPDQSDSFGADINNIKGKLKKFRFSLILSNI